MQQITQAVRSLWCTNSLGIGLLTCGIATLCAYGGALAKPVERIGDWEIVCAKAEQTQASPSKSACRMIQNHVVRGKDPKLAATVLLVTILPAAHKADEKASRKTRMPVAIVSVPQGVYLAPGIALDIDGKQKFKLLYETCNASGCHAGFQIKGRIATALRQGNVARTTFHDHKQKPIVVKVSLKGLTKGLKRLAEVSG